MDRQAYRSELSDYYVSKHPSSREHYEWASGVLLGGGSHNLRLFPPFPFYLADARGATITDIDGNTYVDFWQGHFANVLGHNPQVVLDIMRKEFDADRGLISGFPTRQQAELAELIRARVDAERVRFTTSGALATMNAILLARAYTGRRIVVKIAGGWHGGQPFALKGIHTYEDGLGAMESAGLPECSNADVVVTRFNDIEDLERVFEMHGSEIACFITEPMVGSGGLIFADPAYLRRAQELTKEHGALLILDEVITGFRLHAGPLQALYRIKPDLTVFGKAIGGGMPVAAVAGREDVMSLAAPGAPHDQAVKFDGGTFSAHPAAMTAGVVFLRYLIEHEDEVYPYIGRLGRMAREGIEERLQAYGINARCGGDADPVSENSSLVAVHVLTDGTASVSSPDQVYDPARSDMELRDEIFRLAMLKEGFHVVHGYGGISFAHTEEQIQESLDAFERIARRLAE
ncbi:MAG: aminotransferase class III-fold pyridoxal phosphate-dependent enzyme [Spirochaetes bacterium]|jgi:glutamate-1-semialdehyde 2,1-aminomutase|nr:aminotransferase class III-fold pyridoxal phosphate-dependent enzyme [Spirochaetota bacterium]